MRVIVDIAVDEHSTYCYIIIKDIFRLSYFLDEYINLLSSIKESEKVKKYFFDKGTFIMNPLDDEFGQSDIKLFAERYRTLDEIKIYENNKDKAMPLLGKAIIISGSSFEIN